MNNILNRIHEIQDEWNKPIATQGAEITEEDWIKIQNQIKIDKRKVEIKARLNELSEDMIQYMYGETITDIASRKVEFIELHNELRVLEGKQPRANNLDNRRL